MKPSKVAFIAIVAVAGAGYILKASGKSVVGLN